MPNQYKNKVVYGDSVLMDITDTTAEAGDVASGAVFYAKNGARTVGTFTQAQSDWDENDTTDPAYILNKPTIPTNVSELTNDEGYIRETDNAVIVYMTLGQDGRTITINMGFSDLVDLFNSAKKAYFSIIDENYRFMMFEVSEIDSVNGRGKLFSVIDGTTYTIAIQSVNENTMTGELVSRPTPTNMSDLTNDEGYIKQSDEAVTILMSGNTSSNTVTIDMPWEELAELIASTRKVLFALPIPESSERLIFDIGYVSLIGNLSLFCVNGIHAYTIDLSPNVSSNQMVGHINSLLIEEEIDDYMSSTSQRPVENRVITQAITDLKEDIKPKWTYLPHRTNPAIDAHNSYSMANATKLGTASTLRHNLMLEANWNTGYFIATWTESTGNKDYADSSGQTSVYAVCYRDVWNQRPEKTDADIAISSTVDVFPHNETVLDVSGNSLCTIVAASDSTVRKLSSGYIFIGTVYGSDGKYHIVYRTADTSTTPSITLGSTINVLKINGSEWDMTTLRSDYTQKTSQLNTYIILRNNVYYMAVVQNGVGVAIMKSTDCMDWELHAHIPDPDAYLEACMCALPWISNNMPQAYVAVRHNYGDGYITLFGFDGVSFTKQMEKVYIPASTGRPMMFSDANVNQAYLCFSVNGRRNAVLVRLGSNNDGTTAYEILTTPFNVMSNYPCAVSNNKIILFGGTNALGSAKNGVSICPLWSEELRNYNAQSENLIDVVEHGAFIPNFTSSDNGKILSIDSNGDVVATAAPSIPSASSSTPLVDGTASAGSSTAYARGDHVHPVSSIAALSDTNISSPSTGQALVYDNTSSKWVNVSVSASDIGAIPAPQAASVGQFLTYQQFSQDVYGWGVTDLPVELNDTSAFFYELEPTNGGGFIVEETFANIYQIFSSARKTYFIAIDSSTGYVCIFTIVGVNSYTQTILLLSASDTHEENFLRLTLYADNEHNLMYGTSISTITIPNLYDTTLQILSDTTISNPSSGQVLTYDDTSFKWVNSTLSLPSASSSAPLVDGAFAVVGTSTAYARADHVHPKITQTISMSNNVITLTGSDGSTSSVTLPVYNGTVTSGGGS